MAHLAPWKGSNNPLQKNQYLQAHLARQVRLQAHPVPQDLRPAPLQAHRGLQHTGGLAALAHKHHRPSGNQSTIGQE